MFLKNLLNWVRGLFGKKSEVKVTEPKLIADKEMLELQKENEKVGLIKDTSSKPLSLIHVIEEPKVMESFDELSLSNGRLPQPSSRIEEIKEVKTEVKEEPKKKVVKKDKHSKERIEIPKIESNKVKKINENKDPEKKSAKAKK